jgi:hypothetical protein
MKQILHFWTGYGPSMKLKKAVIDCWLTRRLNFFEVYLFILNPPSVPAASTPKTHQLHPQSNHFASSTLTFNFSFQILNFLPTPSQSSPKNVHIFSKHPTQNEPNFFNLPAQPISHFFPIEILSPVVTQHYHQVILHLFPPFGDDKFQKIFPRFLLLRFSQRFLTTSSGKLMHFFSHARESHKFQQRFNLFPYTMHARKTIFFALI